MVNFFLSWDFFILSVSSYPLPTLLHCNFHLFIYLYSLLFSFSYFYVPFLVCSFYLFFASYILYFSISLFLFPLLCSSFAIMYNVHLLSPSLHSSSHSVLFFLLPSFHSSFKFLFSIIFYSISTLIPNPLLFYSIYLYFHLFTSYFFYSTSPISLLYPLPFIFSISYFLSFSLVQDP